MPDILGIAAIIAKFAMYLGVLTAAGTAFTTVIFQVTRTRALCIGYSCFGIMAAVLGFLLQGANLTGDISGMMNPAMLGLLWETGAGSVLVFVVGGLCLLIVGAWIGTVGFWLASAGGCLAIWSFVQVGHVSGIGAVFPAMALVLHLVAVAFWVGVLTPLIRLASDTCTWPEAAALARRFGRIASITVPLLIVMGGYLAYMLVGSPGALIGTGYGRALLLKIVLLAGLLGFAAANKLRFVPGLLAGHPVAANHLVKSIRAEWVLIVAILAVTAVLTTGLRLPPTGS